jgi:spermidine dehydrogenase
VAWNGPGGVGDYWASNGNTWEVAKSAHQIRDGAYRDKLADVSDTKERYDLVIVGGGFAGLGALHAFRKQNSNGRVLLLDNHAVFGGYGKANEVDVAGFRLAAAQASLNFMSPETAQDRASNYFDELGVPQSFRFAEREDGKTGIRFARSTSSPIYLGEQSASTGYFFGADGSGQWVRDMWRDQLAGAPLNEAYRSSLLALRERKIAGAPKGDEAKRLDTMTFADFAVGELGVTRDALRYITDGMCITGPEISAFGAAKSLPGLTRFDEGSKEAQLADRFISFPSGNTVLARYFVRAAIPDALPGQGGLDAVAGGPINFAALDRQGSPCRIRLRSTAVRIAHEGNPDTASSVDVTYEQGGKLHRVKAKGVVLGIGSWVAKHILADLPDDARSALGEFLYSPMLMVNVALNNWRFLDKLGISAARWFDGLGFYANIRQPMAIGNKPAPFHPDKPIMMTIYVPFPTPGVPLEAQGPAARTKLFGTSYADYERQIVTQLVRMFAPGGFDAKRDIAAIILNRWGHAFLTPPPGFFFGKDGAPPPESVFTRRYGRVALASSADWLNSARAGERAAKLLAEVI